MNAGMSSPCRVAAGDQVGRQSRVVSEHYMRPVSLSEQLQTGATISPIPIPPPGHPRSSASDILSRARRDVTRPLVTANRPPRLADVDDAASEKSGSHVYEEMPYSKYLPLMEPPIGVSTELLYPPETTARQVLQPSRRGNPVYQQSGTFRRKATILDRSNAVIILVALVVIAVVVALLIVNGTFYSRDSPINNAILEENREKYRLLKANYSMLLQKLESVAGLPSSMSLLEQRLTQQSEGLQTLQEDLFCKFHELSSELMTKLATINNMTNLYRCSYKTYSSGSGREGANVTTQWVLRTLEENLSTVIAGVACTTKGGDTSRLVKRPGPRAQWYGHQYQCVCNRQQTITSPYYCIMHIVLCPSKPP